MRFSEEDEEKERDSGGGEDENEKEDKEEDEVEEAESSELVQAYIRGYRNGPIELAREVRDGNSDRFAKALFAAKSQMSGLASTR